MEIAIDSMLLLLLLSRFSRVRLCATPQTAAHQAAPSVGFSRQEYWSGLPFPSPGDLPKLGIKLKFPVSPALTGRIFLAPPGTFAVSLSLVLHWVLGDFS